MKNIKTLIALLAGALVSTGAYAQVELTVTGSTSFRSIVIDRSAAIFDAGSLNTYTFDAAAGTISYVGTMSNKTSLGSTPVHVHLSFSGSASGMLAVKNSTPVTTAKEVAGGAPTETRIPDLALSDVFPGSATPAIPLSAFDPENKAYLGVIPFVYVRNNTSLGGINNITRQQAVLLMTASGTGGMPISFLDGNPAHTANIYMTGRDSGSGTRITTEKCIRFTGTPILWGTNDASNVYKTSPEFQGYSSGGFERALIAEKGDAIGYLGRADAAAIAASATQISFDGIPYSTANVENGAYEIWGYEHMYNRAGGLSANQKQVRLALLNAITDPAYQATPIYANAFEPLAGMHVERGADGGDLSSLDF